ncbi:DUF2971 domain-containing protein [Vibrio vulnificus]|uniref:DUF2971 domain-containing protein n=1 Tax=Vibrio vulnificus TaxID=672 RepID=UPI001CDB8CDD|nr:DUF2971 domain-containing protein [Vibrio vulnificus]EIV8497355.1 hypothetical protein [Vibrio vulnificus]ELV8675369.1 hypothetical protein [Vibrio vulnificus]MCA3945055.1 hypothetical protein [Vibrio vulnificus]
MKLHHYTTIETLALILDSQKIRFNRLTNVDDTEEAELYGKYNIAPFLYVSCWTTNDVENIPLWNMYTAGMKGVRITFDEKPFHYRTVKQDPRYNINIEGELSSPLTLEQMFGAECFVIPSFFDQNNFGRPVEYIGDVSGIYHDAVKVTENGDGTVNMALESANNVALHKNQYWTFQDEYRFTLLALPSPKSGYTPDAMNNMNHHAVNAVLSGTAPSNDFIDLDLCPEKLNRITVTLAPKTTYADELLVRALLEKYCPGANMVYSSLKGKIR